MCAGRNNLVPIVMGAHPDDYAGQLPPHSYILVDDFPSPRHLAKYLRLLDSNDTLYNEYFRWKNDWQVIPHRFHFMWCRLCAMLHWAVETRPTPYVHWYTNYARWWNGACESRSIKDMQRNGGKSWQSWKYGPS